MGRALIVHGGAGAMTPQRFEAAREGCRAAVVAGWQILSQGGSALDAVEMAIVTLENDPGFNAGTGAVLAKDGRAQLDAGLMEGTSLDVGGVACVERVKNPIMLARAVLNSPHSLLMGAGAEEFAREQGITLCLPSDLVTPAQYELWQRGYLSRDTANIGPELDAVSGSPELPAAPATEAMPPSAPVGRRGIHSDGQQHGTVGAVAVDSLGRIAAGASTGGIAAKHPGRIGDTPLPGCGFYAEDGLGGVSSTGHGEDFIRLVLARRALDFIAAGYSAQAAATASIRLLDRRIQGSGGLILLDGAGRVGCARNTPTMAHAFILEGMKSVRAGI
ncbi:MAG: isoaspartyl peptidase/L-asparaginase family protein [Ktedonobacterales bacterium]